MSAATVDDLKMQRDGWLYWGPKPTRDASPRPLFAFIRRLPNGNVLTTDGGRGVIEWGPRRSSASPAERTPRGNE